MYSSQEVPLSSQGAGFTQFLIGLIVFIILILIIEITRENLFFRVRRYDVDSDKLSGLKIEGKIIFISDLNNRRFGRENQHLLKKIKEEKPDIILVGGDMVVAKFHSSSHTALAFMKSLPEICPVYYANGNHELRMKENPEKYGNYEEYKNELQKIKIHVLENESELVYLKGKSIRITGLQLPYEYYKKKEKEGITRKDIRSYIGSPDERNFQILLAHNPRFFLTYKSWGADLTLSGHLHGGIVRIPGWRGVISPRGQLFPKYSGEKTTFGNSSIIVSRGLGNHTIPIRLFNQAELVSIKLNPKT